MPHDPRCHCRWAAKYGSQIILFQDNALYQTQYDYTTHLESHSRIIIFIISLNQRGEGEPWSNLGVPQPWKMAAVVSPDPGRSSRYNSKPKSMEIIFSRGYELRWRSRGGSGSPCIPNSVSVKSLHMWISYSNVSGEQPRSEWLKLWKVTKFPASGVWFFMWDTASQLRLTNRVGIFMDRHMNDIRDGG